MTTQVITRPARAHRRRAPIVVLTALVLVAVVGIVTATVALTSDSADDTHTARAASAASTPGGTCPGDGGDLLAIVASMPSDVSANIVNQLSLPTRALLRSTAEQSAAANSAVAVPDTATLAGVLGRLAPTDAAAVMSGLTPSTRTAIGAAPAGTVCG